MDAYPLHEEATGHVPAPPQRLFDHVDDPLKLSSHMNEPSMAMMGTTMHTTTDSAGGRAEGSLIRMDGTVLGLRLGLEETVVERRPPVSKAWATIGEPRLLVIGAYRMALRIAPEGAGSRLTVSIDYALPRRHRWLGRLLGRTYARWCCAQMLRDAQRAFATA